MSTTIQTVPSSLLSTMNPTKTGSTSTTGSTDSSSSSSSSVTTAQNNFMTMLVTQMQNQDPLNPMDNAQVTSQMAQLSTVTGINQLNTTMTNMMSNFQSSQTLQAANLIGHTVVVPGSTLALSSGTTGSGQFGVQLAAAASNVNIDVKDASGTVVDTIAAGSLPAGVSSLTWDGSTTAGGTAPNGQYTFSVSAANGSAAVTATPLSVGQVSSVSAGTSGTQLNIPNVGATNFSSVIQIL